MGFAGATGVMLDSTSDRGDEAAEVQQGPPTTASKRPEPVLLSHIRSPAYSCGSTFLPSRLEAAPFRARLAIPILQPPTLHDLCRTCASRAPQADQAPEIRQLGAKFACSSSQTRYQQQASDGFARHSPQGGCPWWSWRLQMVGCSKLYSPRELPRPLPHGSSGTVAEGSRSELVRKSRWRRQG